MKKALLFLSIIVLSNQAFSSSLDTKKEKKETKANTLAFTGVVKMENKILSEEGTITIISNTNDTIVNTVKNGKFAFNLEFNKVYSVEFTTSATSSKALFVDLKTDLPNNYSNEQILDLTVNLTKSRIKENSIENLPIAKAYFDRTQNSFLVDYEYTKQLKAQMDKIGHRKSLAANN